MSSSNFRVQHAIDPDTAALAGVETIEHSTAMLSLIFGGLELAGQCGVPVYYRCDASSPYPSPT